MKNFLLIAACVFLCHVVKSQVVINEMMTNNQNTAKDVDNEYSDWIEIYNSSGSPVNIGGYHLSDDSDSLLKWQFPSYIIPADSFLIVWCSGKNRTASGNNLHTNFAIESFGETVFLSDGSGIVIDNMPSVYLIGDKSYGRIPDGSASIGYLDHPSFRSTNNSATFVSGIISEAPSFNLPGGFYTTSQILTLSHSDPGVTIRYTTDGSEPTDTSPVFSGPIFVQSRIGEPNYYSTIRTCYNVHSYLPDWYPPAIEVFKCTVIRARAFKNGYFASPIHTQSYFIDPSIFTLYGDLPVVSVVSDPKHLFSDSTGIYVPGINYQPGTFKANYYKDWDRPANIEMYMAGGSVAFNSNFKISINGQSSPSSPQKGLNVNASSDYGDDKINYPLFENTGGIAKYIRKFDKIKLRAWGSDRKYALFHDAYCASFFQKSDLDYEAYRPVIVFIDGEYWGLHEMRERNRNPEYYESHYFIDTKKPGVDIIDGAGNHAIEGDALHWDAMMSFINNNTVSDSVNYEYVKTQLDVNSFMLNYMSSIYFARGDWPDQNEGKWRPRIPGGKWKWMQWDMDNTAAYYLAPWYNMYTLVMNGARGLGPSALFDTLMLNQEFRNGFINLMADYMNTEFLPSIASMRVDEMRAELLPYFSEYQNRWQLNYTWQNQTDSMKWWMNLRPTYVKQQTITTFSLGGIKNLYLDVSDTAKGNIKVNTILLDENTTRTTTNTYPWTGQYFVGVPVTLAAIPKPGYKFVKWLPSNDSLPIIMVNLINDTSITALFDFDPDYHEHNAPVINEVMSSNDSVIVDNYGEYDDWLEIFNPDSDTIDVAGYYLTDNLVLRTRYQFATGSDSTKIPPLGYLLVWIDNDIEQGILHTNFKFNKSGDFIALVAPDGNTIIDSISIIQLNRDESYGRQFDAAPQFIIFNPSTPGASNFTVPVGNVVINELQTINVSTIPDNYGEYNQWIEIYNPNSDTVDLGGWHITNDPLNMTHYTIPMGNDSTKVAPFGFKLLWADNDLFQGVLHLNFGLQQNGCVSLFKPDNSFDDSICYTSLAIDQSFGRLSDGNGPWVNFIIPTPDSNNVDLTIGMAQPLNIASLKYYPNPVYGNKIQFNVSVSGVLYDALGRQREAFRDRKLLDVSGLEGGIYFIHTDEGVVLKIIRIR